MTPEQKIDAALDSVLRASGSALKYYTMQKTLDGMRAAMRKTSVLLNVGGYWCIVCGRCLQADDDGTIVHDDVPDPRNEQRGMRMDAKDVIRIAESVSLGFANRSDESTLIEFAEAIVAELAQRKCSQCGQEFGPGDCGYSHCENHIMPNAEVSGPLTGSA